MVVTLSDSFVREDTITMGSLHPRIHLDGNGLIYIGDDKLYSRSFPTVARGEDLYSSLLSDSEKGVCRIVEDDDSHLVFIARN